MSALTRWGMGGQWSVVVGEKMKKAGVGHAYEYSKMASAAFDAKGGTSMRMCRA
jgi:hypothetical protein